MTYENEYNDHSRLTVPHNKGSDVNSNYSSTKYEYMKKEGIYLPRLDVKIIEEKRSKSTLKGKEVKVLSHKKKAFNVPPLPN
mmetsp:Transcript_12347/g.12144  ORF Transcript_12347/g.12144 Transcript_12347/m.12144 type:complete len:82 (-) Transcript_12347:7-252(-)